MRRPLPQREEVEKPELTEVLAHYGLDVHRSGMHLCIFHDESGPSMSVDLRKGLVNCHACGKGGDSWRIIEIKESLDFRGAREFAARTALATEARVSGAGDEHVSGSHYTGGRKVASGKRNREGGRPFKPSWSRAD